MPRSKDTSPKITIIYDKKQGASVCKSFRLTPNVTIEDLGKMINNFLKESV